MRAPVDEREQRLRIRHTDMFTMNNGSLIGCSPVVFPLSSCNRRAFPGHSSASAFTRSSAARNGATRASSRAPNQRPNAHLRQRPTVHARQALYGRIVAPRADNTEALTASGILP